ncbi:hypothetical protein D3C75_224510 [compost metagenome]
MLKATVPGKHAQAVEAFIEDQTIMTCESGLNADGNLTISNYNDSPPSEFWEFLEELLMYLPFGTQVQVSKSFTK